MSAGEMDMKEKISMTGIEYSEILKYSLWFPVRSRFGQD
jgi:hypothetical protein